MNALRHTMLLLASLPALVLAQAGRPAADGDPLRSPACLASRQALDAAMAQDRPAPDRLRVLRQRVAGDCLRAAADPPRPARLARPAQAVAPIVPITPAVPLAPATPGAVLVPAVPQPPQVNRCDAGGCFDNGGQRLNRSGAYLVDPQGRMCTQQGSVLVCP